MTSQINPNNINGNYPVAGVPNDTQGMRDNFTNTATNFQYAADEITALQTSGVFKTALTGTTLDNNMSDNLIYAVKLNDVSWTQASLAATSGSITLDYSAGAYQSLTPTGSVSLGFSNWPASGSVGTLTLLLNITNTAYTLTLPAAVNRGVNALAGASPGTAGVSNTITFAVTGYFAFVFTTTDGGLNIWVDDINRAPDRITSNVTISNTAPSTSTSTGALVVAGGIGVGANLNVGGNLVTYTSANVVAFSVRDTGFVSINAPTVPANIADALNIVGSADGSYQPIYNAGSMVHVTGNDGVSNRITLDTFGTGATIQTSLIMRLARGTAAAPTAVQSGDILGRITGSGFGNASQYVLAAGNIGTLGIDFVALENYTSANAGSALKFYTSPVGSVAKTLSANVTANVTAFPGNVTASNVVVSGSSGVVLTDAGTMGYGAGSGGTITQSGNKNSSVGPLDKPSGEITMAATNLTAGSTASFTFTNSTIGASDLLLINLVGGGTAGAYFFGANCTTGSAVVTVVNRTAGNLGEALVLRYAVIKGSIT